MRPGQVARRDGEYQRCGTANVFCGVQPKAGRYFPKVTPNRSSPEFADYLLDIAIRYPEADTIHLGLDNLSSHTRRAVVERFGEKAGGWLWDRFTVHYTPKHGSWLTKPRLPSACSRDNAWGGDASAIAPRCAEKLGPGAVV